jgi:SAM-dependent methyltransferase
MDDARRRARALAYEYVSRGDAVGWFEPLYRQAAGDPRAIQWADLRPNPHLMEWAGRVGLKGDGSRALVVGCGLGDDAEALSVLGFRVVAFDVAPTAVEWSRRRFPNSAVEYVVADLLTPAAGWQGAFDFVLEAYTLQVLPPNERAVAVGRIAELVAPGGTLLVLARGREPDDDPGHMPWPLVRSDLAGFTEQ